MPQTTNGRHKLGVAPKRLKRDLQADVPDRVWLADVSYVPTDKDWLYLATVKDVATMEIFGWSMSDSLKKGLAIDAMRMALQDRRSAPDLICHSDRGVQFASGDYRKLLATHHA
ncbi:MAG: DDE-type integrase/transposase/recombinase [Pseudomonadota bacterium]